MKQDNSEWESIKSNINLIFDKLGIMESYNSDPKPGRLILPLVLIGMIATTYTFVNRVVENNNLEIIEETVVEETVVEETVVEETSTTTTTTIPEDVVQYLRRNNW